MNQPIAFKNIKNFAIAIGVVLLGLVPLALFGLCILTGLLFQVISLTFN